MLEDLHLNKSKSQPEQLHKYRSGIACKRGKDATTNVVKVGDIVKETKSNAVLGKVMNVEINLQILW